MLLGLMSWAARQGWRPSHNELIAAATPASRPETPEELLRWVLKNGARPEVVSLTFSVTTRWFLMLRLVRAAQRLLRSCFPERRKMVLNRCREQHVKVDVFSYNELIAPAARASRPETPEELPCWMVHDGVRPEVVSLTFSVTTRWFLMLLLVRAAQRLLGSCFPECCKMVLSLMSWAARQGWRL
jgi:hypothetical protein